MLTILGLQYAGQESAAGNALGVPGSRSFCQHCKLSQNGHIVSTVMSIEQVIGLVLALLLMFVGLVGSVLPGLPGPPLVLAAAFAHRVYFGQAGASNLVLGLMIGLMLISLALDYTASLVGAKRFGATWRGVVGAAVGGMVGLLVGPVGLLLGPFVGATALEALSGRDFREASRAGAGAFLGLLGGAVGKVACCLAMIGLFAVDIVFRS